METKEISISASYDPDLARMWWDDNFKPEDKHSSNLYLYTDGWQQEPIDTTHPNNYECTLDELRGAVAVLIASESQDLDAVNEHALESTGEEFGAADMDGLHSMLKAWYGGADDEHSEFMELLFPAKFRTIAVRGYSQGDWAQVLTSDTTTPQSQLRQHFERLFYDAPIYATLQIDGEEVLALHDYMDDIYEWDTDEIIKIVIDNYTGEDEDEVVSWVKNNIDSISIEWW